MILFKPTLVQFPSHSELVFPKQLRNGKCSNPGILQHSVTFYQRCLCQNLFSNLPQFPDIGKNSNWDISNFQISGQSIIKRSCHYTSGNNDMKLKPVTKLAIKNKGASKNFLARTLYRKIVTLLSFFKLTAKLEQSGSRIPDTQSLKLIFSLTGTFYFKETKKRTKKSVTQLPYYCFE